MHLQRPTEASLILQTLQNTLRDLDESQSTDTLLVAEHQELKVKKQYAKDVSTLLVEVPIATAEQRGEYDVKQMVKEAYPSGNPVEQELKGKHVDFQHPHMQCRAISDNYRGMFATQAIAPSQLIMVSKAFAFASGNPNVISLSGSSTSNSINEGACTGVLSAVVLELS